MLKRHCSFQDLKNNQMICVIRGAKIIKVLKQFLLPNYAFFKKFKDTSKNEVFVEKEKKMTITIFGMPQASCFFLTYTMGCFCFFLTRESLILSGIKQKILYEIKQLNNIKPKKNYFFLIFGGFFLTKKISLRKCLQKSFIPFT